MEMARSRRRPAYELRAACVLPRRARCRAQWTSTPWGSSWQGGRWSRWRSRSCGRCGRARW